MNRHETSKVMREVVDYLRSSGEYGDIYWRLPESGPVVYLEVKSGVLAGTTVVLRENYVATLAVRLAGKE